MNKSQSTKEIESIITFQNRKHQFQTGSLGKFNPDISQKITPILISFSRRVKCKEYNSVHSEASIYLIYKLGKTQR